MILNKVTTPTQEMIDIARTEALQRTWNDNNNYTKFKGIGPHELHAKKSSK